MMIPTDLLHALAAALDEDLEELKTGTTRRVPECTKRQAFLLVLLADAGYTVGQLADWMGRHYSVVHNAVNTAQDYYDIGDMFFLNHYGAAQAAYNAWLQTQPEEA